MADAWVRRGEHRLQAERDGSENGVSGVWTDPVEYGSLTGGEQPNGPGSTPAVVDGVVYVGSLGKNSLLAYDAETGEELWRFGVEGSVRDDPAVADGHVYFHQSGDLYALDAETGELVWEFEEASGEDLIVHDERVYLGGSRKRLQVFEAEEGKEAWIFDPKSSHVSSIAMSEGDVYAGCERIYSLDAETGEKDWERGADEYSMKKFVPNGIPYTVMAGGRDGILCAIDTDGRCSLGV